MNKLDKENLHKEIDLIQACIDRMAKNSFLLKGWTITIIAVVLALSEKNVNLFYLCLIVLFPLISFWYLDAFFLYTEKLYRKMYEWIIRERPNSNSEKMYDLNPHRFKNDLKVRKWNKDTKKMEDTDKLENVWTVMRSITLRCFYFIPILLVVIIMATLGINQLVSKCKKDSKNVTAINNQSIPKSATVITTIQSDVYQKNDESLYKTSPSPVKLDVKKTTSKKETREPEIINKYKEK